MSSAAPILISSRFDPRLNPYAVADYEKEADNFSSSESEIDIDLREHIREPPKIHFDETRIAADKVIVHSNRGMRFLLQRKSDAVIERKLKKKQKIMQLFNEDNGELAIFGEDRRSPDPKPTPDPTLAVNESNTQTQLQVEQVSERMLFTIIESSNEENDDDDDDGYKQDIESISFDFESDSDSDEIPRTDSNKKEEEEGSSNKSADKKAEEELLETIINDSIDIFKEDTLVIGEYSPVYKDSLSPPTEVSLEEEEMMFLISPEITVEEHKRQPTVQFDFDPELDIEALKIPPRKVHGYDNLAHFKIAATNRSVSYKRRNELYNIFKADNKFNPYKMTNLWNSQADLLSANAYWKLINTSSYYQSNTREFIKLCERLDVRGVDGSRLFATHAGMFQPNNMNVSFFKDIAGVNEWQYMKNPMQIHNQLPLRLCGKKCNFYEPLVQRFKVDMSGRKVSVEGLCPYCTINPEEMSSDDHLEDRFFKMRNHQYESHLARFHGVYGNGVEMKIPGYIKYRDGPKGIHLLCMECHRINDIGSPTSLESKDSIMEYFTHCMKRHYHKRIEGSTVAQVGMRVYR